MTNHNIKTINVHELKHQLDVNTNLCLIDVREQEEWDMLHIPNACHIPKDSLPSCIESKVPNKNYPIYLHCKAGVRSLYAAQCLVDMGYQEVYSVDGGITEWSQSGYPVVNKD